MKMRSVNEQKCKDGSESEELMIKKKLHPKTDGSSESID